MRASVVDAGQRSAISFWGRVVGLFCTVCTASAEVNSALEGENGGGNTTSHSLLSP